MQIFHSLGFKNKNIEVQLVCVKWTLPVVIEYNAVSCDLVNSSFRWYWFVEFKTSLSWCKGDWTMNIGITKPKWRCEINKNSRMFVSFSVLRMFWLWFTTSLKWPDHYLKTLLSLICNSYPTQFQSYDRLIR